MVIYNADPNELIEKAAIELAKIPELKPPEWSKFVKTGSSKERPPAREDWWFMRAASILRKLYKYGPIGVSKLRTYYGGKKNRGHKPDRFVIASGNIIRKILQQLEAAELAKQVEIKGHKGRTIAPKGRSMLDKIAVQLTKGKRKALVTEEPKKVEKPKAENTETPKEDKKIEDKKAKVKDTKEKTESKPKKEVVETPKNE